MASIQPQYAGCKVAFVPFTNGRPAGPPEDFLTGFLVDASSDKAYGRPVDVVTMPDGALLVTDDVGHHLWRVSAARATAAHPGTASVAAR